MYNNFHFAINTFAFENYIFVDETTIRLSERPIYHQDMRLNIQSIFQGQKIKKKSKNVKILKKVVLIPAFIGKYI
ncbi:hypothetical protein BpHYR1_018468 [Brachionus plicatilis]|uniref:Uncharacterized protein n=1 Tax=Brachionus plicatilis TaxID=10195 RepID=A0A3M7Q2S4_BRAPC|nr:hypothetical protein BpHYR1_018468 [Brachionus plicatilis]